MPGLLARTFLIIAAHLLITSSVALAEDRDIKIIIGGLEDYKTFGSKKAISSWLKYGPHENTDYSEKLIETFTKAEILYGDYKSYDIIKKHNWSSNVIYYILVFNYDKGPLFAKFMLYKYRNEMIVYNIELDPNPEIIISEIYFDRSGPESSPAGSQSYPLGSSSKRR